MKSQLAQAFSKSAVNCVDVVMPMRYTTHKACDAHRTRGLLTTSSRAVQHGGTHMTRMLRTSFLPIFAIAFAAFVTGCGPDAKDKKIQDLTAENDALKKDLEGRSEEHTSELQSRVDISYAVFC